MEFDWLYQLHCDLCRIFDIASALLDTTLLLEFELAFLCTQITFDQIRTGGGAMLISEKSYKRAYSSVGWLYAVVSRIPTND
jgi:hypothetical protein